MGEETQDLKVVVINLVKLQRQIRILWTVGAWVLILLIYFVYANSNLCKEKSVIAGNIKAKQLVIVGNNGEERAVLNGSDDRPCLDLFDSRGMSRISLTVVENGRPYLELRGKNGHEGTCLGVDDNGKSYLVFQDKEGKKVFSVP